MILKAFLLVCILSAASLTAQVKEVPVPPDAPTVACRVPPSRDPATLRVLARPATFVFACNVNKNRSGCIANAATPSRNQVIATGATQGAWICVFLDGVPGWLPSNSLASLPDTPHILLKTWVGWYRQGRDHPGIENDRLLIVLGKTPGTLHVSGVAFWYGLGDDEHFGKVDADATPYGPYLHVIYGNGPSACVLDLIVHPATHTLATDDNENCGGMNVRFWGTWTRFTPKTSSRK